MKDELAFINAKVKGKEEKKDDLDESLQSLAEDSGFTNLTKFKQREDITEQQARKMID